MAVVIANALRIKPEIRLAQAVSQFEADLSTEQKATFRFDKSQWQKSPPDISHVMQLTADIDRRVSGQTGSGRCFGPRLTNFLQAVQQFAALGDVTVGSSQSVIACSVWSLVRMSLLVCHPKPTMLRFVLMRLQSLVNFSCYFEKLSSLLMTIGCSAPRYQTMALLYPRSKSLQSHLFEYFTVVVRLNHYILKLTQKSAFMQFASTLSDSDIKVYQSDLDLWANTIKVEVNLLLATTIEQEAKESSRFRSVSSKHSEALVNRQRLERNLRILNMCSTYDYQTTWKQTRKIGNAASFRRNAHYQDWKVREHSCTLVYVGKLGAGKSVLLANLVDDINLDAMGTNIPVAYFFCRHDVPESLKARTVIGSLAQQLLRRIPDLTIIGESLDETTAHLDHEGIVDLLHSALPPNQRVYFILDGLDECDQTERKMVIEQLRRAQKAFTLFLCVSLRQEPSNTLKLDSQEFVTAEMTFMPDDNPDIKAFVGEKLENCIESRRLILGDPALVLEIHDTLLDGSHGMFLWVALQIESLCGMKTDDDIRQALADLPRDLPETFSRILRKCDTSGKNYQREILELITVARRPLTTEELREALSVVPGDAVWNPARLLNNVFSVLLCCGSLLVVDEEELTVRFVHHSVKQFLLDDFKDSSYTTVTTDSANRRMANLIITYLSYGVFETQLSTTVIPKVMAGEAPSNIIHLTLDSSTNVRNLALKLLKYRNRPDIDISKTLAQATSVSHHQSADQFHFFSYAKSCWLQHLLCTSEQVPTIYQKMLLRLFKGNLVDTSLKDEHGNTPLALAAQNGHQAIVQLLHDSGTVDADPKNEDGRTPLWLSAENGHTAVVELLLSYGNVDPNVKDAQGKTSRLQTKVQELKDSIDDWKGQQVEDFGKLLLQGTYTVDFPRVKYITQKRAIYIFETVVMCCIENSLNKQKYKLNGLPATNRLGKRRLQLHTTILTRNIIEITPTVPESPSLYIHWRTDDREKCMYIRMPTAELMREWAAEMVRLRDLGNLSRSPSVQARSGGTPLWCAAQNRHDAVVKAFLDSGKVNANVKDGWGRTVLSWMASKGDEDIVKVLLSSGKVDANIQDCWGFTPLILSAGSGHEAVAKLLIDSGIANIGGVDESGRTALAWAAEIGHEAIVRLLLNCDNIDANTKDRSNRTPLSGALEGGHVAIVELLLNSDKVDAGSRESLRVALLSFPPGPGRHEAIAKLFQSWQLRQLQVFNQGRLGQASDL